MNNKMFFYLLLFACFPAAASDMYRAPLMRVTVDINAGYKYQYDLTVYPSLNTENAVVCNVETFNLYGNIFIKDDTKKQTSTFPVQEKGNSIYALQAELDGQQTKKLIDLIKDENKFPQARQKGFFILAKLAETDGYFKEFIFQLQPKDVAAILDGESSYMPKILAGLGIAGLIALICYFKFYVKRA